MKFVNFKLIILKYDNKKLVKLKFPIWDFYEFLIIYTVGFLNEYLWY